MYAGQPHLRELGYRRGGEHESRRLGFYRQPAEWDAGCQRIRGLYEFRKYEFSEYEFSEYELAQYHAAECHRTERNLDEYVGATNRQRSVAERKCDELLARVHGDRRNRRPG